MNSLDLLVFAGMLLAFIILTSVVNLWIDLRRPTYAFRGR